MVGIHFDLSHVLGVIKLETQNEALLLKYLHKFYNNHNLPWINII
jgi:hypothetical protein